MVTVTSGQGFAHQPCKIAAYRQRCCWGPAVWCSKALGKESNGCSRNSNVLSLLLPESCFQVQEGMFGKDRMNPVSEQDVGRAVVGLGGMCQLETQEGGRPERGQTQSHVPS